MNERNSVERYSKPRVIDQGAVERLTQEGPGEGAPESFAAVNIVWSTFTPERETRKKIA